MSPEKYIKEKARMLPLGKCYTYANRKDAGGITVIVSRIHPKGTVTCADFCIDKLCRGVRGTRYFFNISPENLEEIVEYYSDAENDWMVEIPYEVAHNLIYGSIVRHILVDGIGMMRNFWVVNMKSMRKCMATSCHHILLISSCCIPKLWSI